MVHCKFESVKNGHLKNCKVDQFITLSAISVDLSEKFNDAVGELHMQAISNRSNGQYCTPTPICDMMASI
jgi:hypothetical protein